jgi:hypothetical protein
MAHRERLADGSDRAEAASSRLRRAQQVEVDLDLVDLLHAADVGVSELLERVGERTGSFETRGGVHDLVAMDAAAPALQLVLRMERYRGRALARLHAGIVVGGTPRRKS